MYGKARIFGPPMNRTIAFLGRAVATVHCGLLWFDCSLLLFFKEKPQRLFALFVCMSRDWCSRLHRPSKQSMHALRSRLGNGKNSRTQGMTLLTTCQPVATNLSISSICYKLGLLQLATCRFATTC